MKTPIYEIFVDGRPVELEVTRTGEHSFTIKKDEKTFSVELPDEKLALKKGFVIKIDGKEYCVGLREIGREKPFPVKVEEVEFQAEVRPSLRKKVMGTLEPTRLTPVGSAGAQKQVVEGAVTAPMTGRILSVTVRKGDRVKSKQVLCVLEAMKMENEISASKAGTVQEVYVTEGSSVKEGEVLLVLN